MEKPHDPLIIEVKIPKGGLYTLSLQRKEFEKISKAKKVAKMLFAVYAFFILPYM